MELVGRVSARGTSGVGAFIAGFVVGDLIWFGVAVGGVSLLAQSLAVAFIALKYVGAAYLAFLAWKTWNAATDRIEAAPMDGENRVRLFLGGLALTLSNPKVILFFLALLPSVVDLDRLDASGFIAIGATIVVVLSTVLSAYALAAARARRVFTSARARRAINRVSGSMMAGAAVVIATR